MSTPQQISQFFSDLAKQAAERRRAQVFSPEVEEFVSEVSTPAVKHGHLERGSLNPPAGDDAGRVPGDSPDPAADARAEGDEPRAESEEVGR